MIRLNLLGWEERNTTKLSWSEVYIKYLIYCWHAIVASTIERNIWVTYTGGQHSRLLDNVWGMWLATWLLVDACSPVPFGSKLRCVLEKNAVDELCRSYVSHVENPSPPPKKIYIQYLEVGFLLFSKQFTAPRPALCWKLFSAQPWCPLETSLIHVMKTLGRKFPLLFLEVLLARQVGPSPKKHIQHVFGWKGTWSEASIFFNRGPWGTCSFSLSQSDTIHVGYICPRNWLIWVNGGIYCIYTIHGLNGIPERMSECT